MAPPNLEEGTKLDSDTVVGKADPVDQKSPIGVYVGWAAKFIGLIATVVIAIFAVVSVLDDRIQGHANTLTSGFTALSETLTAQISEIKLDVRHLDSITRESDKELRNEINEIHSNLSGMQVHLQRLSTDVGTLAEDVQSLTDRVSVQADSVPHNYGIRPVSSTIAPAE